MSIPHVCTASQAKRALITPTEWLEPGHGLLCRDCRFYSRGPNKCQAKQCQRVLKPERGYPGLVLHVAGNETCDWYEPEIILNLDLSAVEAKLLERLCRR